ncbi:hypothetical protein DFP72DRAFT_798270 [Ephemerocybe angulata]|uniref:HMG domain-containing protein n=1 Tax=Ephemerocybe angulata TaxID=980116 RepID=A0A8H6MEH6_9AGAR|nr:hypothetical protein DFP72DRAFT_798270 [Tulosesus angulatus]
MPPKKHKKRALVLDHDFSDEDYGEYPTQLTEEVKKDVYQSPTKKIRVYQKPQVGRKNPNTTRSNLTTHLASDDEWGGFPLFDPPPLDTADVAAQAPDEEPPISNQITDQQLACYREAVSARAAGLTYIEDRVMAVEGWNLQKGTATGLWYHLEYLKDGQKLVVGCCCPASLQDNTCIHQHFLRAVNPDHIRGQAHAPASKDSRVTIFLRQRILETDDFFTIFSVRGPQDLGVKGRAMVTHTGSSPAGGSWHCSKSHSGSKCTHVPAARKALCGLLGLRAEDLEDTITADLDFDLSDISSLEMITGTGSVSYLPVLPPITAMLKSDIELYPRPHPFRSRPTSPLPLSDTSTCPCPGPERAVFNRAAGGIVTRTCRVYTLLETFEAEVQLQPCPNCYQHGYHYIGPDLRDLGLFNYNNTTLVSHELMDEYTIAFSSSETLFSAFVVQMNHRYANSKTSFMGADLFRETWFSFMSIQAFENDMQCARCGPYPETVIWDGVTLAFHKKHLSSTLAPPTILHPLSFRRPLVKRVKKQQTVVDPMLRKKIRKVLEMFTKSNSRRQQESDQEDDDTLEKAEVTNGEEETGGAEEGLSGEVDKVREGLHVLCPALEMLFLDKFGFRARAETPMKSVPRAYSRFFLQIAAEESAAQLVIESALLRLRDFLSDPREANLTMLIGIPGLYKLLRAHNEIKSLVPIAKWIEERATSVHAALSADKRPIPLISSDSAHEQPDWRLTGCFYSLGQIRYRPHYPSLGDDLKKIDSSRGGDTCGKYYSEYGERRLTGGIMVVWCTHSVAYGFHSIPSSEGRNDVFSALVTRWPVAPKRIVYDFACALGPYCMLREPEFFKDTLFVIDNFHSKGHTKCSPAAFLKEYSSADLNLISINSSAGESGNSALRRIRKGVSYMTQDHAIIYTKVFLSMWNRSRMIKKRLQ